MPAAIAAMSLRYRLRKKERQPPSINRCGVAFEVEAGTIHYALAALKGVGRQAVEEIVDARGSRPFRDLAESQ